MTSTPTNPAQIITDVIKAAATKHVRPVKQSSLFDVNQSLIDHYLRARLNSIIAYHLFHNHQLTRETIATAYRLDWQTIDSRIRKGQQLITESPWKQTYLQLP